MHRNNCVTKAIEIPSVYIFIAHPRCIFFCNSFFSVKEYDEILFEIWYMYFHLQKEGYMYFTLIFYFLQSLIFAVLIKFDKMIK